VRGWSKQCEQEALKLGLTWTLCVHYMCHRLLPVASSSHQGMHRDGYFQRVKEYRATWASGSPCGPSVVPPAPEPRERRAQALLSPMPIPVDHSAAGMVVPLAL
jgi:hypothetical protein